MQNQFSFEAFNKINTENGLKHAVLESILSDARAFEWQAQRFGGNPNIKTFQRGWCLAQNLNEHGSKIWLLAREKATQETQNLLISYLQKALEWINENGFFEIITEQSGGRINFKITVHYQNLIIEVNDGN